MIAPPSYAGNPWVPSMIFLHHEQLLLPDAPHGLVELCAVRCAVADRRAAVRAIIGEDYQADPHGRPVAKGRSISIAHAGSVLVVAQRVAGRVGVDVELLGQGALEGPPPVGFSSAEREAMMQLDGAERAEWIVRMWTAKEALSKALGLGQTVDFAELEVMPRGAEVECVRLYGNAELAAGWQIVQRRLPGAGDVLVAVAVHG